MNLVDVTLRESVYTDLILSYQEALFFLKEIVRNIDSKHCQYIEIGYIDQEGKGKPLFRV